MLEDWEIWARHWLVTGSKVFMDQEIPYGDQHSNCDPIVCMGGYAVVELDRGERHAPAGCEPEPGAGLEISAYLWEASGPAAVAIDDASIATPTFTFTAAGTYLISLTVSAPNGKSTTGYRKTVVHDAAHPPVQDFQLNSCSGDYDSETGDYSFEVTRVRRRGAGRSARASHGHLVEPRLRRPAAGRPWPGSPVAGFENILAFGWIGEDENIQWSADGSSVTFSVFGPGYWMAQSEAYPGGLKDAATINDWKKYQDPTVDAALWNLLHWRSTVDRVIDVILPEDTRTASGLLWDYGTLWSQLNQVAGKINARARVQRARAALRAGGRADPAGGGAGGDRDGDGDRRGGPLR